MQSACNHNRLTSSDLKPPSREKKERDQTNKQFNYNYKPGKSLNAGCTNENLWQSTLSQILVFHALSHENRIKYIENNFCRSVKTI